MIVLDASTLIAFLDPSDALHASAVASVLGLDARRLVLSPLTHAEVLVGPVRAGTLESTEAALTALDVSEVGLPANGAQRLARLRANTKLRLPDCCVILAAQQTAGAIMTFDAQLAAAAGRLGIVVEDRVADA